MIVWLMARKTEVEAARAKAAAAGTRTRVVVRAVVPVMAVVVVEERAKAGRNSHDSEFAGRDWVVPRA